MRENTLDTMMMELGRLVGTWSVEGDATGVTAFRWNHDSTGIIQEAMLDHNGVLLMYTQVITRRDLDSLDLTSRLYTMAGNTIDHLVELHDGIITAIPTSPGSPPCTVKVAQDSQSYACQWKHSTEERGILATKVDNVAISI